MFRNTYDSDNTVFSPQGRLHQVEYALEAVKQGSAVVGLRSKSHAVLVALKRAPSELASHQRKMLKIDNHIGMGFAGLTSDARVLRYVRDAHSELTQHLHAPADALVAAYLQSCAAALAPDGRTRGPRAAEYNAVWQTPIRRRLPRHRRRRDRPAPVRVQPDGQLL